MNRFIYFLLFLNIFNILQINAQFVQITPDNAVLFKTRGDIKFTGGPMYSTTTSCSFNYDLSGYDSEGSGLRSGVVSNDSNAYCYRSGSDGAGTNYYTCGISMPLLQIVTYTYTITSNNDISTTVQITQECKGYDENLVTATVAEDVINFKDGAFMSNLLITGFESVEGIRMITDTMIGQAQQISQQGFIFFWNNGFIMNNLNTTVTGSITAGTKVIYFSTKSSYQDIDIGLLPEFPIETTYYPSNILSGQIYNQFGYDYVPVFETRIKTNIPRPYQMLTIGKITPYMNGLFTVPLKGVKGDMMYIGFFPKDAAYFNGLVPREFTMTNQVGGGVINEAFNASIQFYYPPYMTGRYGEPTVTLALDDTVNIPFPILTLSYSFYPYKFTEQQVAIDSRVVAKRFPFGFANGNNNNYNYEVTLSKNYYSSMSEYERSLEVSTLPIHDLISLPLPNVTTPPNLTIPQLISYEFVQLSSTRNILKLEIVSLNGIKLIQYSAMKITIPLASMTSGTIYNGKFEFSFKTISYDTPEYLFIVDIYDNTLALTYGSSISGSQLFYKPSTYLLNPTLNATSFRGISFLHNDINLVNVSSYNEIFVEARDIPINTPICLILNDPISYWLYEVELLNTTCLPLSYNVSINAFSGKFVVPKNNIFGEITYNLMYGIKGYVFSSTSMLRVSDSYLDNQGPIFTAITKIGQDLLISNTDKVGWRFKIEDDYNGFESGIIVAKGTVDSSNYTFTFNVNDVLPGGNKYIGEYEFLIQVDAPCITQSFQITNVILIDTNGQKSRFNLFSVSTNPATSPFYKYFYNGVNAIDISNLSFKCPTPVPDTKNVELILFTASSSSATSIDVGILDRSITFDFEVSTPESGIKQGQSPVVYILSSVMGIEECISTFDSNTTTSAKFKCTSNLPVGFGYPGNLLFSVYGFISNNGAYYGFSSDKLKKLNFDYYTETKLTIGTPILTGLGEEIFSTGGKLVILGYSLQDTKHVLVQYLDGVIGGNQTSIPVSIHSSGVVINDVRESTGDIKIVIVTNSNIESNELIISPIRYGADIQPTTTTTGSPISTTSSTTTTGSTTGSATTGSTTTGSTTTGSTTTGSSTTGSPPTNPPQKCLGNPQCGGDKQGYCTPNGCICYAPWIGNTCTSQIIVVPQPTTNNTFPSIEIPIDSPSTGTSSTTSGSNNPESNIFFKSLISLVSLREVDFKFNQVKNYYFEKWIFTPLSSTKNQYFTSVPVTDKNSQITYTNVTATLEWFNSSTIVEFANSKLTMNPSSIKYTIEISAYPFASNLNQLQLIMSALFESSKTDDVCSVKEFGNTTSGDNSNFIKIQIEDRALYGRFIKRAIIDGQIKSVENVLLDSSLNSIETSSKSQSYIGIQIYQYQTSVTIDPDFSVIIDSTPASNQENSICDSNSSGLSAGQLAGIIIGSIAFASVIVVSALYHFKKKKKDKSFKNKMMNISTNK